MAYTIEVQRGKVRLGLTIYPSPKALALLLVVPGLDGGHTDKYEEVAEAIAENGVAAVIQMPNTKHLGEDYLVSIVEDVRTVCSCGMALAPDICATASPNLWFYAVSAGAGAIGAEAYKYRAEKILLLAMAGIDLKPVQEGLAQFQGELYVIIGDHDEVVGTESGQKCLDLAVQAKQKELIVVPHCGHGFEGVKNHWAFVEAADWAFAGDKGFANRVFLPDPMTSPFVRHFVNSFID